jgi:hypothetical protein
MTYLVRTNGTATSTTTFTISTWVKRSELAGDKYVFSIANNNGSGPTEHIHLRYASDKLQSQFYISSSQVGQIETTAYYRDPAAWYHIVFRFDSTQGTANNRMRLYINGEETDLGTQTMPSQDASCAACSGGRFGVSVTYSGTSNPFKGYMAQFIYADGQSYDPTTFGSTNANGVWVGNSQPSVTYGNNGFKLDFTGSGSAADANGFGADSSGNGNHLATAGEGTNPNTKDGPENNFCTLDASYASNKFVNGYVASLSKGNLETASSAAGKTSGISTFGVSSGKWYAEFKQTASSSANNYALVGIHGEVNAMVSDNPGGTGVIGYSQYGYAYWGYNATTANGNKMNNDTSAQWGASYDTGDIIMLAVDLDNNKIYAGKNGTWQESGDPTSGASGTGAMYSITDAASVPDGCYHFCVGDSSSSQTCTFQTNFGNPVFAVASSNSDANGYGSFEYAVPSGYYALCTENLGAYGG